MSSSHAPKKETKNIFVKWSSKLPKTIYKKKPKRKAEIEVAAQEFAAQEQFHRDPHTVVIRSPEHQGGTVGTESVHVTADFVDAQGAHITTRHIYLDLLWESGEVDDGLPFCATWTQYLEYVANIDTRTSQSVHLPDNSDLTPHEESNAKPETLLPRNAEESILPN
ncbi:hypothetical protein FRB99_007037 [Tulasnella sp. 403]|nr:hypothetical protein FRB99_007037 [Tulasnella sp. 403]